MIEGVENATTPRGDSRGKAEAGPLDSTWVATRRTRQLGNTMRAGVSRRSPRRAVSLTLRRSRATGKA